MKIWFVRSLLVLMLPFVLIWTFFAKLFREIRRAFWYSWQEVLIEAGSFRRCWNEASKRMT